MTMKTFCCFVIFLLGVHLLTAQNFHPEYENDYLGWIKLYQFKGVSKAIQVDEKRYSAAQLSIADSFANWMQASYMPKGMLGDIKKFVTPKKDPYHERYNEAMPYSYGAASNTFLFLKKKEGRWVPENNLGYSWTIAANQILADQRLMDFNTSSVCLFTMAGCTEEELHDYPNSPRALQFKMYDLSDHPVLKKYILYNSPSQNNTDIRSNVVILSKDNRMPFVHVTIGEALQFAEAAIPVKLAEQKQSVAERYANSANDLQFFTKQVVDRFESAKQMIQKLREKYKDRLGEFAYTNYGGFSFVNLANGHDVFSHFTMEGKEVFDKSMPIMRVDPQLLAQTKTNQPQWIMIRWWGGELTDPSFKHLHESILNNFDFDYVYNFFFDSEKIKGQLYKPLRSPLYEEKIVTEQKSVNAQNTEKQKGVFFYDDFSTTPVGSKPVGWKSEVNSSAQYTQIVNLPGRAGKWLQVKGHSNVFPTVIKKNMPSDFELSFNLAVPKDIPWGAKALEFFMGTKGKKDESNSFLKFRFRAGFYGRPGEISLDAAFDKEHSSYKSDYAAIGFSNDKDINAVKVLIRKKGEQLQLWLDENLLADIGKAIPVGTIFNWLQFDHSGSDADNQVYYIGDFKIIQL